MTRKEAQRRLTAAIRDQRTAQEEVREANALVVAATSRLPPHYVEKRLAEGERERIQKLIDRAQKASDRLGAATANVVNLRRLVANKAQGTSLGRRHHATKCQHSEAELASDVSVVTRLKHGNRTKKSPAQLQREIDEVLAKPVRRAAAHVTIGRSSAKKHAKIEPSRHAKASAAVLARAHATRKKQEIKIYDIDASIVSDIDNEDVWSGNFEIPADNNQAASKLAVELLRESRYYDARIDPRVVLDRVEHIGEVEVLASETPEQTVVTLIAEARKTIP